jgi:hypothetical protein
MAACAAAATPHAMAMTPNKMGPPVYMNKMLQGTCAAATQQQQAFSGHVELM